MGKRKECKFKKEISGRRSGTLKFCKRKRKSDTEHGKGVRTANHEKERQRREMIEVTIVLTKRLAFGGRQITGRLNSQPLIFANKRGHFGTLDTGFLPPLLQCQEGVEATAEGRRRPAIGD